MEEKPLSEANTDEVDAKLFAVCAQVHSLGE
jgi:hypothetical protein